MDPSREDAYTGFYRREFGRVVAQLDGDLDSRRPGPLGGCAALARPRANGCRRGGSGGETGRADECLSKLSAFHRKRVYPEFAIQ